MAEKILMLALSPTMEKGMIVEWLKNEGDAVSSGDVLCEVETDKTTMDYESTSEGVLLKIVLAEGSDAAVGDVIAIIGEEGEDISDLQLESASEKQERSSDDADSKETPSADESAGEPASDDKPKETQTKENRTGSDQTKSEKSEPDDDSDFIKASPLARKLADKHDLKLSAIKGSGPDGRIVKVDIEKALDETSSPATRQGRGDKKSVAVSPAEIQAAPEDLVLPVSKKRKVIAQRLSDSKYSAPHYYLKLTVEMDDLLSSRKQLNAASENKVSIHAFFLKFIAEALKKHPRVNSSWNKDTIIQHGSIDIGIAVAQEDGLITPVVRNCGNKGIFQIDRELQVLIEKARSNSLKPEEYSGATFTVSNLGSYGIEDFTAIINPPGSAILAVGAIKKAPVVQPDDSLVIRSLMKLSLSCDHRVIDGAVGAEFLTELKEMMESPIRALF